MRLMLMLGVVAGLLGLVVLLLRLWFPLPPLEGRRASQALPEGDSRLARLFAAEAGAHPGLSGILPLPGARESFAARVLLVRSAERSLDLQYYIWKRDTSGLILLDEVLKAATRGVRVRLLLDDNGTTGLDAELMALDRHPMVEVRLFNPFTIREPKLLNYLIDFPRLNRRMHNKSLTADGVATIVGGRNVADSYFGTGEESLFADLDVLAVGAVVPDVARDFDRYWNSRSAYPVAMILGRMRRAEAVDIAREVAAQADRPLARAYSEAVAGSLLAELARDRFLLEWTRVTMVSDDPAKGLDALPMADTLLGGLSPVVGTPARELGLVSAYFVPTDDGVALFGGLARQGIQVTILTNALNATDVAVVHAGYAKHRRALLEAGVRLFELKGDGKAQLSLGNRALGSGAAGGSRPVLRSQGTSLHAKTFTVDRERLFVGSFNFDPRSARLNTELGFVIESPRLAGELQDALDSGLGATAYRVMLADNGRLLWEEQGADGPTMHAIEPNSGPLQRTIIALLGRLPIDWML
jgi:putative cardiolipin synthase